MANANSSRGKRRSGHPSGKRPRTNDPKATVPGSSKADARGQAVAPAGKKSKPRPDMDAILGRLSDSFAIVETACNALEAAQENENLSRHIGPEVLTLRYGIRRIQSVYTELDLAILGSS